MKIFIQIKILISERIFIEFGKYKDQIQSRKFFVSFDYLNSGIDENKLLLGKKSQK